MNALVSRVTKAQISVNGEVVSSIERGLAVFVAIEKTDSHAELEGIAAKIVNLRIFEDEQGKMNHSVKDKNYQILAVSNFTLCASTAKGRRPSFEQSMPKQEANKLFEDFLLLLRGRGIEVACGVFGEHMDISLTMDGPVNIILNAKAEG